LLSQIVAKREVHGIEAEIGHNDRGIDGDEVLVRRALGFRFALQASEVEGSVEVGLDLVNLGILGFESEVRFEGVKEVLRRPSATLSPVAFRRRETSGAKPGRAGVAWPRRAGAGVCPRL